MVGNAPAPFVKALSLLNGGLMFASIKLDDPTGAAVVGATDWPYIVQSWLQPVLSDSRVDVTSNQIASEVYGREQRTEQRSYRHIRTCPAG